MQVALEKIHQSYGKQTLFSELNLTIPSGQFFTLLGPSGCGKTTLLRMLAGFVRPDNGSVLFGIDDVTQLAVHQRDVGMVFQDYALFPDRSVLSNVCYGLLAHKVDKKQAKELAMVMLQRVGLAEYADKLPASLSGGQRQRVAMARALVINPRLLLLDEPLSALDVKLRVELRTMIKRLQQEAGITTVFVTHDQEEALAVSDLIAVMDKGKIVQLGTPKEIYLHPKTAFVADFVGKANIISIERELPSINAADGVIRRFVCGDEILYSTSTIAFSRGKKLAVRSEDITFLEPAPPQDGQLSGVIELVQYRGSTTYYEIQTAVGIISVITLASRHKEYVFGDIVRLQLPLHAHLVEDVCC